MRFSRRQVLRASLPPLAAALAMRGLTPAARADDEPVPTFFRIGTGSTAGTYYPVGGLLAAAISHPVGSRPCEEDDPCGVNGMIAMAQSTEGSVDNVTLMRAGSIDSGLCQADIAYWATTGQGLFAAEGPVPGLRVIASLFSEMLHVVVRHGAGIAGLPDLRGKRVSLDLDGSGTRVDALLLLRALGINLSALQLVELSAPQAVEALRQGTLDAFFWMAGPPVPAVESLAREDLIDLLPVAGPAADSLAQIYPFFSSDIVPAGTYPNVGVTTTLSVPALWLVNESVPEEIVYGITRTLWSGTTRKLLDSGHPQASQIRLEHALRGIGQPPLHAGALRYYREIGLPDL